MRKSAGRAGSDRPVMRTCLPDLQQVRPLLLVAQLPRLVQRDRGLGGLLAEEDQPLLGGPGLAGVGDQDAGRPPGRVRLAVLALGPVQVRKLRTCLQLPPHRGDGIIGAAEEPGEETVRELALGPLHLVGDQAAPLLPGQLPPQQVGPDRVVPLLLVGPEPGDDLDRVILDPSWSQARSRWCPSRTSSSVVTSIGSWTPRRRMSCLRASNSSGGRSGRTWNRGLAVVAAGGMAVVLGEDCGAGPHDPSSPKDALQSTRAIPSHLTHQDAWHVKRWTGWPHHACAAPVIVGRDGRWRAAIRRAEPALDDRCRGGGRPGLVNFEGLCPRSCGRKHDGVQKI